MNTVQLRRGGLDDLTSINDIITRAIGTWTVAERVKRLSLPLYHYQAVDLDHLDIVLAMDGPRPLAVAAWEPAEPKQLPPGRTGLLLHGLYVAPDAARGGLGTTLLQACLEAAREGGLDGVLVKATRDAAGFFERSGFERLPVLRDDRDYELRYWLPVSASGAA
ncbi:MAG: GNAT family N-acetyltransferase [Gammaproteobacteria bacterium]|nr:MAG: GNAT family N-acetyltransferase [Gammaproteobacteria bacterium]